MDDTGAAIPGATESWNLGMLWLEGTLRSTSFPPPAVGMESSMGKVPAPSVPSQIPQSIGPSGNGRSRMLCPGVR